MTIRVLVNGAQGKMGQASIAAIQQTADLVLAGAHGRDQSLPQGIQETQADVVVDFTHPNSVFENTKAIIQAGARPVIGTTGLTQQQVQELQKLCADQKLGGVIAPNFSLGVILMMRLSQECARYFPHVEIIEMHHNKKVDSPSGTAIRTAQLIMEAKTAASSSSEVKEMQTLPGARGARYQDIPIHSVRLPGLLAHQEVIFGDLGQTLTIREDTTSREAYMPGVCLACRKVMSLDHLVFGLENIL
jgi:4-hydroxy-tetrahydrodipicolinate reductase